jgi:hypothetical protein
VPELPGRGAARPGMDRQRRCARRTGHRVGQHGGGLEPAELPAVELAVVGGLGAEGPPGRRGPERCQFLGSPGISVLRPRRCGRQGVVPGIRPVVDRGTEHLGERARFRRPRPTQTVLCRRLLPCPRYSRRADASACPSSAGKPGHLAPALTGSGRASRSPCVRGGPTSPGRPVRRARAGAVPG